MRINSTLITLAASLALCSVQVFAADSPELREAAAARYLEVVPMKRIVDDTFLELAKQLPAESRAKFLKQMGEVVRVDVLVKTSLEAMVKVFTTDELNALADFYGSKEGVSAMKKFSVYMGQVMPVIQQEIQRAVEQLKATENSPQ